MNFTDSELYYLCFFFLFVWKIYFLHVWRKYELETPNNTDINLLYSTEFTMIPKYIYYSLSAKNVEFEILRISCFSKNMSLRFHLIKFLAGSITLSMGVVAKLMNTYQTFSRAIKLSVELLSRIWTSQQFQHLRYPSYCFILMFILYDICKTDVLLNVSLAVIMLR